MSRRAVAQRREGHADWEERRSEGWGARVRGGGSADGDGRLEAPARADLHDWQTQAKSLCKSVEVNESLFCKVNFGYENHINARASEARRRDRATRKGAGEMTASQTPLPKRNRRPERVVDLLYQGGVHDGLWAASARKPRYYVVNLRTVISLLGVVPGNMRTHFEECATLISTETDWANQVPVKFGCNYTHIQSTKVDDPKYFEHAATIIFALEKYAARKGSTINVYDYLRIMPAHYFVDEFDSSVLKELSDFYTGLTVEEREAIVGPNPADKFEVACLKALDQPQRSRLIKQMGWGFCVTRYIADHLRLFINTRFPSQFHVGRVLASGQDANMHGASKSAAADLVVPRTRQPGELVVVPLHEPPTELQPSRLNGLSPTDPQPISPSILGIDWAPIFSLPQSGAAASTAELKSEDPSNRSAEPAAKDGDTVQPKRGDEAPGSEA